MSDAPKRTESTELTIVRPRESLAPMSTRPVTIEDVGYVERTLRSIASERETQMECPWCHGDGLVAPELRQQWLAQYPELAADQPPPSQPDPTSEPPPRAA